MLALALVIHYVNAHNCHMHIHLYTCICKHWKALLYTISVQHIGVLQDELFDERWFNFLRDHSAMHQSRTAELLEEDPPVVNVTSIYNGHVYIFALYNAF